MVCCCWMIGMSSTTEFLCTYAIALTFIQSCPFHGSYDPQRFTQTDVSRLCMTSLDLIASTKRELSWSRIMIELCRNSLAYFLEFSLFPSARCCMNHFFKGNAKTATPTESFLNQWAVLHWGVLACTHNTYAHDLATKPLSVSEYVDIWSMCSETFLDWWSNGQIVNFTQHDITSQS